MSGAKVIGGIIAAGIAWWWLTRKPTRKSAPPSSYVLIGDSLGEGLGPPLKDELKPAKLTVAAHTSANAQNWAYGKYKKELDQLLLLKPDGGLLISLGTNDTAGGAASELSDKLPFHFKLIADAARAAGVTPIFIEPPALLWYDQRVIEAAVLAGARLIKTPEGLAHASDNIHLTISGYRTWAKFVAAALK